MSGKINERVIRLEKGETLYVVCPPYQPFRVFFDSKLNDLAIAECEPQDVPQIEENAPAIPERMHVDDSRPIFEPSPGTIVDAEYPELSESTRDALDSQREINAHTAGLMARSRHNFDEAIGEAIEHGLIKPVFPDRFDKNEQLPVDPFKPTVPEPVLNRPTEAAHIRQVKHVLGANVIMYGQPALPESSERNDQGKPVHRDMFEEDRPVQGTTDSSVITSDIPFFNDLKFPSAPVTEAEHVLIETEFGTLYGDPNSQKDSN